MRDAVKMRMVIPSSLKNNQTPIDEIWLASDFHVAVQ
jgi:hypothetical protein